MGMEEMQATNKFRRHLTRVTAFLLGALVLGIVCLGYDAHVLSALPSTVSAVNKCSWDTFIVYVKVFVAMDAIAVAFILLSFLGGCLLSRNTTGQFAQAKRMKFIKVLIVLTAFALAADIVAEIIRILFFANLLGWEYENTWDCAVPMFDITNTIQSGAGRALVARIQTDLWWFYPFTTFVCGFAAFVLRALAFARAFHMLKANKVA
ncbi:Oidioi.mRNA.OKI2018_I69.PAR.g8672.t1.cds [Oikopleura dioica]|uniref:Oidioi.mRNA.OKI2018_I69.PAR.g8672.t1.cds n=1 Tax=Oikopleura dioica TaxID=34765 RepID=A0ABN7RH27_OIKDI|nr:Oidioi.mRNA.OKI2018_I69.PAR.g8672.t1.cds [Oikopleura dioica]